MLAATAPFCRSTTRTDVGAPPRTLLCSHHQCLGGNITDPSIRPFVHPEYCRVHRYAASCSCRRACRVQSAGSLSFAVDPHIQRHPSVLRLTASLRSPDSTAPAGSSPERQRRCSRTAPASERKLLAPLPRPSFLIPPVPAAPNSSRPSLQPRPQPHRFRMSICPSEQGSPIRQISSAMWRTDCGWCPPDIPDRRSLVQARRSDRSICI